MLRYKKVHSVRHTSLSFTWVKHICELTRVSGNLPAKKVTRCNPHLLEVTRLKTIVWETYSFLYLYSNNNLPLVPKVTADNLSCC